MAAEMTSDNSELGYEEPETTAEERPGRARSSHPIGGELTLTLAARETASHS